MNRWKRAIETWFTGKEEQMVRQIADLVAVPSVGGESAGPCQPFGEGPAKALEVALLQAQAAGLRAENQGGYVLTADLNDCPDELHILAHLDVVAPGEGWDTDPYTLVQEGDLIYGRGVDDDKGPAVAAMMAMECVKALNVPLKRNVKLVLGTDEESGSRDIAHYYATVPYAPCSFSPDAEFPVINIEKGLYTPVITGQWEAQPELPQVVSLTGGIRINVVPRQAEAVIHKLTSCATTPLAVATGWVTGTEIEVVDIEGGVKITCTGRDAHASTPEEGTNAITALLCLLAKHLILLDILVEQLHGLLVVRVGIQVQAKLGNGEIRRLKVLHTLHTVRVARLDAACAAIWKIEPWKQRSFHQRASRRVAFRILPLERDVGICQRRTGGKRPPRIAAAFSGLGRLCLHISQKNRLLSRDSGGFALNQSMQRRFDRCCGSVLFLQQMIY